MLQNNFLPILPEELDCAKLSTQAKDYSGLENDRGDYFVAVKEMNRSLNPTHCFFSIQVGATAAGSITLSKKQNVVLGTSFEPFLHCPISQLNNMSLNFL